MIFLDIRSIKSVPCFDSGSALSACWAPFDLYMESAMDGKQLPVISAIAILTGDLKDFFFLKFVLLALHHFVVSQLKRHEASFQTKTNLLDSTLYIKMQKQYFPSKP